MSSNEKPLEFGVPNQIPIIGQPFELVGWYATALLRCHCRPDKPPVVIPEGAAGVCPSCHQQYLIVGKIVHPTQGFALQIGMARPEQAAPSSAPESIGG